MIAIKGRLKFRSDYHTGSGEGIPGVVDSGLSYDAYGLPKFTGRHIKGLLQHAVMNLMELRGAEGGQKEEDILKALFMGENDEAYFRYSVRLRGDIEREILNDDEIKDHLTRIEFHTAVERDTKIAKKGSLHSIELGPRALDYDISIEQIKDIDNKELLRECVLYLVCGMRFLTHVGGKRRRGKGLARIEEINVRGAEDFEGTEQEWKRVVNEFVRSMPDSKGDA